MHVRRRLIDTGHDVPYLQSLIHTWQNLFQCSGNHYVFWLIHVWQDWYSSVQLADCTLGLQVVQNCCYRSPCVHWYCVGFQKHCWHFVSLLCLPVWWILFTSSPARASHTQWHPSRTSTLYDQHCIGLKRTATSLDFWCGNKWRILSWLVVTDIPRKNKKTYKQHQISFFQFCSSRLFIVKTIKTMNTHTFGQSFPLLLCCKEHIVSCNMWIFGRHDRCGKMRVVSVEDQAESQYFDIFSWL